MTANNSRRIGLAVLVAALVAGCQPPPPAAPAPGRPAIATANDACAEQLQELSGQLLEYYAIHRELPPQLEDLTKLGAGPSLPLACPLSRRPYIYNPDGLAVPGWPGRLIVYDPLPSHEGSRWAIQADKPQPGKPLFLRVVRPPNTAFGQ